MRRSLLSTKVNANVQMFQRRLRGRGSCQRRLLIKWKNSVWKERISFDLFVGVSGSWMISPHKRAYINRFLRRLPPVCCRSSEMAAAVAAYWWAIGWLLLNSPHGLCRDRFQLSSAFMQFARGKIYMCLSSYLSVASLTEWVQLEPI